MRLLNMLFQTKLVKLDGGWLWEVKRRKQVVASGVKPKEAEAKKAMEAAVGKLLVETQKTSNEAATVRAAFKTRVTGRPYLAAFVVRSMLGKLGRDFILADAEQEEARLYNAVTGRRLELHPCATPPAEMAQRMMQNIDFLWPKEKPGALGRLERWARDFLGDSFVLYLEGKLED